MNRNVATIIISVVAIGMSLYSAGLNRGLALSYEWERRYYAEQDRRETCEAKRAVTCISGDPKGCR